MPPVGAKFRPVLHPALKPERHHVCPSCSRPTMGMKSAADCQKTSCRPTGGMSSITPSKRRAYGRLPPRRGSTCDLADPRDRTRTPAGRCRDLLLDRPSSARGGIRGGGVRRDTSTANSDHHHNVPEVTRSNPVSTLSSCSGGSDNTPKTPGHPGERPSASALESRAGRQEQGKQHPLPLFRGHQGLRTVPISRLICFA